MPFICKFPVHFNITCCLITLFGWKYLLTIEQTLFTWKKIKIMKYLLLVLENEDTFEGELMRNIKGKWNK